LPIKRRFEKSQLEADFGNRGAVLAGDLTLD
jgi:hypothetical protein